MNKIFLALNAILVVLVLLLHAGCTGTRTRAEGERYLQTGNYVEGVERMSEIAARTPEDGDARYYLGRLLAAQGSPAKALPHLAEAVRLQPDDADRHFWLGAARYDLGDRSGAEAEFGRAAGLDAAHIQARLSLARIQADRGNKASALSSIESVLALEPDNDHALFSRAELLDGLGRSREATAAWLTFLSVHPEGPEAWTAAERLNERGNLEYRNHIVGARRLTLSRTPFAQSGAVIDRSGPLEMVGQALSGSAGYKLHVVAYAKGDAKLAETRAKAVKRHILRKFPEIDPDRVKVSWFGQAETIHVGKKTVTAAESLNFITEWM